MSWARRSGSRRRLGGGDRERGGGTVVMIGVVAVVMAVFWAAIVVAGYLLAGHRAKSAADLAALSGASALVGGRDGCPVAVQTAARQGAAARCRQVGDQIDFVITVTATVRVSAGVPGLPSQVSAVGHAGPVTTGDLGEEAGR